MVEATANKTKAMEEVECIGSSKTTMVNSKTISMEDLDKWVAMVDRIWDQTWVVGHMGWAVNMVNSHHHFNKIMVISCPL